MRAGYLCTSSSYLQSLQSLKQCLVMAKTVMSSGCEVCGHCGKSLGKIFKGHRRFYYREDGWITQQELPQEESSNFVQNPVWVCKVMQVVIMNFIVRKMGWQEQSGIESSSIGQVDDYCSDVDAAHEFQGKYSGTPLKGHP